VVTTAIDCVEIHRLVAAIPDPEVPVLSLLDLGVLRSVEQVDGRVVVTITPTYSGCPAMHHIEARINEILDEAGVDGEVRTVFSPAWTTDWMTPEGRSKLRDYGIAPPRPTEMAVSIHRRPVECPHCGSSNTETVSTFGSTACKALHRCQDCLEPFDHFKEL
jgi:ring-1,2-phenylacetyl-CoA epoxidase subunit PaaD